MKRRLSPALAATLVAFWCALPSAEAADEPQSHGIVTILSLSDAFDPVLLDRFGRDTGIAVLADGVATPEAIEAALRAGKPGYDLALLPLSRLAAALKANILAPIALSPEAVAIEPRLAAAVAALGGTAFAQPLDWYPLGFAVDAAKLEAVGVTLDAAASWDVLGKPDQMRAAAGCGLGIPDRPRELFALALAASGDPDRTPTVLDRRRAFTILTQLRLRGKQGTEAERADSLAQGEACAVILPAPAAILAAERARAAGSDADLRFILPAGGSTLMVDVLVLPLAGRNHDGAQALLRFLLQPAHAAANARYGHVAAATRGDAAPIAAFADPTTLGRLTVPSEPDASLDRAIEAEWRRGTSR